MTNSSRHPTSDIRHPFTMPAEWQPQKAMWLAWPHNKNDWPDKFAPIPWVYAEIIRYLSRTVEVRLVVKNEAAQAQAEDMLSRADADMARVKFYVIPTNRVWLRDSGPIFVRDAKGKKTLLDWRFNAWAKYANHKLDDKVPGAINAHFKLPIVQPMHKGKRVVLEGGSIDVNGKGALLTTEECLLSDIQCRNPGFTRVDYEEVFARYLGIDETIWLGDGIAGDDTHGHVDDLARFTDEKTIVTVTERNKSDINYTPLQENLKRLKRTKYNIIELPMPAPLMFEGTRLPASYANFLICNNIVLVPTFNDKNDREALNTLAQCFPRHDIIGIHAVDLVWGFGTLHCMSQQEPQI